MRQIATLPDGDAARTFADYLLTLRIDTRLEREGDGWALWVCDEDRVAEARQELGAFTTNPADPRYRAVRRAAERLRRQEARREAAYRKKQERLRERMTNAPGGGRPVTFALLALSVAVTLATNLGERDEPGSVLQRLTIASYRKVEIGGQPGVEWAHLSDVRHGEVWRLVTPVFLHFGWVHLLFNVVLLLDLGGLLEARGGSVRFLLLVLAVAVCSNLAEYYLGRTTVEGFRPRFGGSPQFGGMSGVLYGVFGYLWIKSHYEPERGMTLSHNLVVILVAWFFLCWSGFLTRFIGPVGNVAHTAGLLVGLAVGYAPTLWRRRRP
jgi:GlpG protein